MKQLTPFLSVADQLSVQDVGAAAAAGFATVINNRPDQEAEDQPSSAEIEAAARNVGLDYHHLPVISGKVTDEDVEEFAKLMARVQGPVLAFCRTGTRSTTLWALAEAWHLKPDAIIRTAPAAGYDLSGLKDRLSARAHEGVAPLKEAASRSYDVLIVGGGAGGISAAAGLLNRRPGLSVALIEPRDTHYYQPGWTLVGGGVFDRRQTERPMAQVMPKGVTWIRAAAADFAPERNEVVLEDGERVGYRTLIAAPGLTLDWRKVDGLKDTLGKNGVTSNYLFDLAPYTWELITSLRGGRALFTQPPMPIKCAGAPQKAMYLACDHWRRRGRLKEIEVSFHNAGGVLFGVEAYVPALMRYVKRYAIDLNFKENLVAVEGPARKAVFATEQGQITREFDMLHVCPPQCAPDLIRRSPLANEAGWIEVDHQTLQHSRYGNIFGLGDACSAPNAKTAAAVRKQAPTVAENVLAVLDGKQPRAVYSGYGSCPLTVERGKIVLAEFGYGGKLEPTFPSWMVDGTQPSAIAWFLKEKMLPAIYFDLMLKGREWLAQPMRLPHQPTPHQAQEACATEPPKQAAE